MRYGVRPLVMDKWIVMQLVNSSMPSHRGFCNTDGSICNAGTGQFWIDKIRHYHARLNRWKCSDIHGFTVGIKILVTDTAYVCEGETQGSAASIFRVKELRSASRRTFRETDQKSKTALWFHNAIYLVHWRQQKRKQFSNNNSQELTLRLTKSDKYIFIPVFRTQRYRLTCELRVQVPVPPAGVFYSHLS